MKNQMLTVLVSFAVAAANGQGRQPVSVWCDSGFEAMKPGEQAATGVHAGWEIQRTGRGTIQPRLRVVCIADPARVHSGAKGLALSIPQDTVGFEFAAVGQRVQLDAAADYEASVWVRWPDGPAQTPAGAGPTSGHRSAIVSFWARHRNGTGDFAGRDEWLFDNQWRRLTFRFHATDPAQPTLVYVSLLPNQAPADTTVLVDDFELSSRAGVRRLETRTGNFVRDSSFDEQQLGQIAPPWFFANMGGSGIAGRIGVSRGGRCVTVVMGKATSNFESAQLWQHLDLRQGTRYEVSCQMRWDNFAATASAPIVNYGLYHEDSRTWYGPVDQVLEKTAEWQTYRFAHIPPFDGTWKLYVQLNGWGNFRHGVTVSFDEFSCAPMN